MITLGLCCICNALKREKVSFRAMTFAGWQKRGDAARLRDLSQVALHNSRVLQAIIDRLPCLGIFHYRISSSLFPLLTHPDIALPLEALRDFSQIKRALAHAGKSARAHGISLSMHPGQFVVLASDNPATVEAALADLALHGKILDLTGAPRSHAAPLNLHMGTAKALESLPERFDRAWARLSPPVKKRLVFENEDKGHWNARRLLDFLRPRGIPMTFDFLHDHCNPSGESQARLCLEAAKTWGRHIPVFHYAESAPAAASRAHAAFVRHSPPDYRFDYICELEAKGKDDAILALRRKFPKSLR